MSSGVDLPPPRLRNAVDNDRQPNFENTVHLQRPGTAPRRAAFGNRSARFRGQPARGSSGFSRGRTAAPTHSAAHSFDTAAVLAKAVDRFAENASAAKIQQSSAVPSAPAAMRNMSAAAVSSHPAEIAQRSESRAVASASSTSVTEPQSRLAVKRPGMTKASTSRTQPSNVVDLTLDATEEPTVPPGRAPAQSEAPAFSSPGQIIPAGFKRWQRQQAARETSREQSLAQTSPAPPALAQSANQLRLSDALELQTSQRDSYRPARQLDYRSRDRSASPRRSFSRRSKSPERQSDRYGNTSSYRPRISRSPEDRYRPPLPLYRGRRSISPPPRARYQRDRSPSPRFPSSPDRAYHRSPPRSAQRATESDLSRSRTASGRYQAVNSIPIQSRWNRGQAASALPEADGARAAGDKAREVEVAELAQQENVNRARQVAIFASL